MDAYCKPILGLWAIRSATFVALVRDYERVLAGAGYNRYVARLHLHTVTHFGVWLQFAGSGLETVDEECVAAFDRHRLTCQCPGTSRNGGRHVVSCVRVFLRYLRERGVAQGVASQAEPAPLVRDFRRWMGAERGVVETTHSSYQRYVSALVEFLGEEPQEYTARGLRDFVDTRYGHYGRNSIRVVLAAVRMFLRYLTVQGHCRPGLEHALIAPAHWSQQSLPRGLSAEQVQRVLTRCPSTPRGVRDRAILLLLIRLGLRAGDVASLRLSDLCFETGTIRVCGKGAREVRLPLPQDVGDALLAYLRDARPRVQNESVFLRSVAPFKPFAGSRRSHAVTHVACSALKRAGVHAPTWGAHVFRHTAACEMLRRDVELEGIAAVLRHRSIETTGLYAKVDVRLLQQVAQPWPEVAPC